MRSAIEELEHWMFIQPRFTFWSVDVNHGQCANEYHETEEDYLGNYFYDLIPFVVRHNISLPATCG